MKTLDRRTDPSFVYNGFGFPVVLQNVPMVRIRGCWTPDVDFNRLAAEVLLLLARRPVRMTGDHVRFIRHQFEMTLQQFAEWFSVTHPAVIEWEACGRQPTKMDWATEKDIRLEIILRSHEKDSVFVSVFGSLRKKPPVKPQTPIELGTMLTALSRRSRAQEKARA